MNLSQVAVAAQRPARLALAAGLALLLVDSGARRRCRAKVYVLPTSGIVDQIMSGYIHDGIAKAQREGAAAVADRAQYARWRPDRHARHRHDACSTAPLPVIVWVGPSGLAGGKCGHVHHACRVTSRRWRRARTSARPRRSTAAARTSAATCRHKVIEDTLAHAAQHLRCARPQLRRCRHRRSPRPRHRRPTEAVAAGIVNGIADTPEDAVALANGRTVTVNGQPVTLALDNAQLQDVTMNPLQSLLHLLSDPNIAFILFTLGFYGLFFELAQPNFVTGILGGIAIILAFIGFGSLPLNLAGLLLIGLGMILFILELTVTSHGLLTIGGHRLFRAGRRRAVHDARHADSARRQRGVADHRADGHAHGRVHAAHRVPGHSLLDATHGARAGRRRRCAPNTLGEVRRPLTPIGSVYAGGEEWTARAADERELKRGTLVRVIRPGWV